jgi:cytochrome c
MACAVPAAEEGDPVMGKRMFAQCGSCHSVSADGPPKVGPHLHGLFGRKAGSVEGFAYSQAMQQSGIVWDETSLDAYMKKPAEFIPGNKMVFAGVPKDQMRKDILAYLKEATQ